MVSALFQKPAVPQPINDAKAYGKGLENGMAKDEYVWFFVSNISYLQKTKLAVSIRHEQGNYEIPFSIFMLSDGACRISYKRDVPGNYQIDVMAPSNEGNEVIAIASKHIKVDTDFNLAHFELQDYFIHCVDMDRTVVTFEEHMYSFYIQTRNWKNGPIKEGGLKFSADMKYIHNKSDVPMELVDLKDGNYRVNFQPGKSGRYSLDLGLMSRGRFTRIKGSPFECSLLIGNQVDACIDPGKTVADWSKFRHRAANDLIRFLLEAVDRNGDAMHTGGSVFDAHVVVPHSKEDLDPGFTLASGPGLVGGCPGKFTHFNVHPKNSKGQLILETGVELYTKIAYGSPAKELIVDMHDNGNGSYRVSYCPLAAGVHTISVFLVDNKGKRVPITGSPFTVDIDPAIHVAYANNCHAFGIGMVSAKIGQESTFFIQARNKSRQDIPAKLTDFQAYLESEESVRTPMAISENQDGTLTVSYTVHKPGYYTGYVLLVSNESTIKEDEMYISCTPFMVEVVDKLDVTKSSILGLEKGQEFVIAPITFKVATRNSSGEPLTTGGENLEVKIEGPNKVSLSTDIYDNFDGVYDVCFKPLESGVHTISVFHEGQIFVGCPYQIGIEEAVDSTQSSTTKYMFVIQMRTKDGRDKDTGGDFFEVQVIGPDGEYEDVQVLDVGDGSLLVEYSLGKPGEYWIKAVLNNKPLHGFPFKHVVSCK